MDQKWFWRAHVELVRSRQTGHMDLTCGPDGRWWAIFLGVRPQWEDYGDCVESQLGRETFLAPLEWTSDDWPVVNSGEPISLQGLLTSQLPRAPSTYSKRFSLDPKTGALIPPNDIHFVTEIYF